MGRKRGMVKSTCSKKRIENESTDSQKECNDLQHNIHNKNESDMNHTDGLTDLKINVDESKKEKNICKEVIAKTAAKTNKCTSRPRRKSAQVSYCPPQSPSSEDQTCSSGKKTKTNKRKVGKKCKEAVDESDDLSKHSNITEQSFGGSSNSEDNANRELKNASADAIALEKLQFDICIDPNITDQYTDSGFTAEGSFPESPETRRQRIDIISRQCRLHPANEKYNQGPVENPPLISPGKMVGFTPGGQRHEVDLNADRPTWFNSEYARIQWDYATKVNVTRMFHQLETGKFLPDSLDPNIERRCLAEKEIASKQAIEHFQKLSNGSSSKALLFSSSKHNGQNKDFDMTEEDRKHLQLLGAENELIELNQYAVVRFPDFAEVIVEKLRKALDLPLTPLMVKKNPGVLDTLDTLAKQCIHVEVVVAARALLDKIKGLFKTPENERFQQFFADEVDKLRNKTKNMNGIDILMMTEEPPEKDADDSASIPEAVPPSNVLSGEQNSNEPEDDWVPVINEENWLDLLSEIGGDLGSQIDDLWKKYNADTAEEDNGSNSSGVNEHSVELSDSDGDLEDHVGDIVSGSLIKEE